MRGHIGRAGRRAGKFREQDEAADHQHEGDGGERENDARRPGLEIEHARAREQEKDRIGHERRGEQHEFGEERTGHRINSLATQGAPAKDGRPTPARR
jgi:hypothetical protein